MKRALALLLALVCAACGSQTPPDPAPSVLVTTIAPRQGRVPRRIIAYGAATPASNGTQTLSVAQPGQVRRLFVTPGAVVGAGAPLAVFAITPSASAGYEAAVTALDAARRQRDTTRQLLAQQLATSDQLVQAEKTVADAAAALAAQRREGAAEPVQTLTAPFAGVVTAIPVAVGDRTQPGAALVTVARRDSVIVTVGIDPAERTIVAPGHAALLLRLAGGAPVAGHVLRIDGTLDPATHLVDVDLRAPAGALLPGEPLRAEIETGTTAGWFVPHAAVATDGDGPHVFEIVGGKAHAVQVTVAQADAQQDVVTGALAANRPLIVVGAYQVTDGDAVRTH